VKIFNRNFMYLVVIYISTVVGASFVFEEVLLGSFSVFWGVVMGVCAISQWREETGNGIN
jgi:hypothetical protein